MIDAIEHDRPHRTPADLATHVVEAADAIVASAHTGRSVSLELMPRRPAPISVLDVARLLKDGESGRPPRQD